MTDVVEPLRLSVLAELSSLAAVRRSLRTWLSNAGVERADEVVLAVHEAVGNAVEHGGLHAADAIRVEATIVDEMLSVVVRDNGTWKPEAADEARGRGLSIMRSLMDHVDLDRDMDGTRIEMRRRLRCG